jgi:hypothetical protein
MATIQNGQVIRKTIKKTGPFCQFFIVLDHSNTETWQIGMSLGHA